MPAKVDIGETEDKMIPIGAKQSLLVISESAINKFNRPSIGMYASSNGQKTKSQAKFDWFEYKEKK